MSRTKKIVISNIIASIVLVAAGWYWTKGYDLDSVGSGPVTKEETVEFLRHQARSWRYGFRSGDGDYNFFPERRGKKQAIKQVDTSGWDTQRLDKSGLQLQTPSGWGMFEISDQSAAGSEGWRRSGTVGYCLRTPENTRKFADASSSFYQLRNDVADCDLSFYINSDSSCSDPACDFDDKMSFFRKLDAALNMCEFQDRIFQWTELDEDLLFIHAPSLYGEKVIIDMRNMRWIDVGGGGTNDWVRREEYYGILQSVRYIP